MKKLIDKMRLFYKVNRAIFKNKLPIFLQYNIQFKARYGQGKPYGNGTNPHPELYEKMKLSKKAYKENLLYILKYSKSYERIPIHSISNKPQEPFWINGYLPALDAITLYGFIALFKPSIYLEIGSGNSTKFARRAINEMGLSTKIISIDPSPRSEIDNICDEVIRSHLEDIDLNIIDSLKTNDILFFDSSHYVFANSDVVIAFLEILPRLKPGIIVHFHDIFLPYDYPDEQINTYYSEQYMLAAYILAEGKNFVIIQPNAFITNENDLHSMTIPLWAKLGLSAHFISGCSFWIKMKQ